MIDSDERLRREAQAHRNVVAALVIGAIVVVLAGLYLVLLPGAVGALGALCTVGFLLVAFLGWEYLMKPGYGILHRPRPPGREESEEPPSPGAP